MIVGVYVDRDKCICLYMFVSYVIDVLIVV